MTSRQSPVACPDPLARAPRVQSDGAGCDWLRLAPPSLQGALVALVGVVKSVV
jgi:hypothetical protein